MLLKRINNNRIISKPNSGLDINYNHPLSRGLVGCWLFNEGSGNSIDLIKKTKGTLVNYNGWHTSKKGKSFNFDSNFQIEYSPRYLPEMQELSWACCLKSNGTNPSFSRPLGKTHSNAASSPYVTYDFEINPAGAGQNVVVANIGTTLGLSTTANHDVGDLTVPKILLGTYSNGSLKFYVDGIVKQINSTVSGAVLYDATSSGKFIVGGYTDGGPGSFLGNIYWIYIWKRVITSNEAYSLYNFPYQFIAPKKRFFILKQFVAGSGQSITATPGLTIGRFVTYSPTVKFNKSLTATTALQTALFRVFQATATQSASQSRTVTPALTKADFKVFAATAAISVSGSRTVTPALTKADFKVFSPNVTITNVSSKTTTPALTIARFSTFQASAIIGAVRNVTATPGLQTARFNTYQPTVKINASRLCTPGVTVARFVTYAATASQPGQSGLTMQALYKSSISKFELSKSKIEKQIYMKSELN